MLQQPFLCIEVKGNGKGACINQSYSEFGLLEIGTFYVKLTLKLLYSMFSLSINFVIAFGLYFTFVSCACLISMCVLGPRMYVDECKSGHTVIQMLKILCLVIVLSILCQTFVILV